MGDRARAGHAPETGGGHLRRARRRRPKREVLPSGGDGLCQRVALPRAHCALGGGADCPGRKKGRAAEAKEEVEGITFIVGAPADFRFHNYLNQPCRMHGARRIGCFMWASSRRSRAPETQRWNRATSRPATA